MIIIGEAPSKDLNYYQGYETITQNSAGDIIFNIATNKSIDVYVTNQNYAELFCSERDYDISYNKEHESWYIGSLK